MDRSAKEIAGCILAKVNGVGPQASFQQEASQGQHGHQRGSSPRHFRSHVLASNMQASIKCRRSANIWWCAALHAVLTRRWTETSTSTPSRFVGSWVFAGLAFFCEGSSTWKGCHWYCQVKLFGRIFVSFYHLQVIDSQSQLKQNPSTKRTDSA